MSLKEFLAIIFLGAFFVLALSGCGSGSENKKTSTSTTTDSTGSSTPDPSIPSVMVSVKDNTNGLPVQGATVKLSAGCTLPEQCNCSRATCITNSLGECTITSVYANDTGYNGARVSATAPSYNASTCIATNGGTFASIFMVRN